MATTVCALWDNDPGKSLFWLQDTFMELPASIPLDLTSFLWLCQETNRPFVHLAECWNTLKQTGTATEGLTLSICFTPNQLQFIRQQHEDAGMIEVAKAHSNSSRQLAEMLDAAGNGEDSNTSLESQFEMVLSNTPPEDLLLHDFTDFYQSIAYLWRWFWKNHQDKLDVMDLEQYVPLHFLIRAFEDQDESKRPPLSFIPHRERQYGFFRAQCVIHDRVDLIPMAPHSPWGEKDIALDIIEHSDPFAHFLKFSPALQQDTDVVIASLKENPEVEALLSEEVANHALVLAHIKETAEAKQNGQETDDELPF